MVKLQKSSDRLVIIAKGFLKLPNFHMLIEQKKVGQTSEFLFGIYWQTWKITIEKTVEVGQ